MKKYADSVDIARIIIIKELRLRGEVQTGIGLPGNFVTARETQSCVGAKARRLQR